MVRRLLLALMFLAAMLPGTATSQIAVPETRLVFTGNAMIASDYLFRGISQTRSRPALQTNLELRHDSGFYIGAFVSNFSFVGTDGRQEIDLLGGYRFALGELQVDVGAVWYTYPGFSRQAGQFNLNYVEGVVKLSRELGPVTLLGTVAVSPNFFASSGTGLYLEGGVDWRTGVGEVVLGARLAHQFIERNARFGTPDYTWWGLTATRDFAVGRAGTVSATVGYYQTSIGRRDCAPLNGRGQDICGARAFGSLAFKF